MTPARASAPGAVQKRAASAWNVPARAGLPLPPPLLAQMQQHVGMQLSDVRIHEDESVSRRGAHAFARGRHIVFGKGEYQPQTSRGRRLLAHELVHVKQQSQRRAQPLHGAAEGISLDRNLEREADRIADTFAPPSSSRQLPTAPRLGEGAVVQPQLNEGTEGAIDAAGPDTLLKMIAGLQSQFDKVRAAAKSRQSEPRREPHRTQNPRRAASKARAERDQSPLGKIVGGSLAASQGGDMRPLMELARAQRRPTQPATRARANAVTDKPENTRAQKRRIELSESVATRRSNVRANIAGRKTLRKGAALRRQAARQVEGGQREPQQRQLAPPAPDPRGKDHEEEEVEGF